MLLLFAPAGVAFAAEPAVAENLIKAMDSAERSYYFQMFDYSMSNAKAGEKREWKSYNSSGQFVAEVPFVSSSNATCRKYRETMVSGKYNAEVKNGVACKRVGREGWCRLKEGDMQSCALEPPRDGVEGAIDSANQLIQDATTESRRHKNNFWDWWPW